MLGPKLWMEATPIRGLYGGGGRSARSCCALLCTKAAGRILVPPVVAWVTHLAISKVQSGDDVDRSVGNNGFKAAIKCRRVSVSIRCPVSYVAVEVLTYSLLADALSFEDLGPIKTDVYTLVLYIQHTQS